MYGALPTLWCTCRTAPQISSTQHGSAKKFLLALERAKHGNLFAAQKQSVCCPDAKMKACGKCETTERIKWTIQGLYLICCQQGHRAATTYFGVRGTEPGQWGDTIVLFCQNGHPTRPHWHGCPLGDSEGTHRAISAYRRRDGATEPHTLPPNRQME